MEWISKISENKIILAVILCFIFLLLSHVLILPPFEGFDESAHYSYISLLSDRWQIPDFRTTPFDASIDNTITNIPRRYSGTPPYDNVDGFTYYQFFNELTDTQRNNVKENYWNVKQPVCYQPGKEINWEGQHPPLYYLIMVLPYRLVADSVPAVRILFLRLISILLACGSLFFWLKTTKLFKLISSRKLLVTGGVTAVILPSLSYYLARISNDSLVVLLFSGVFYFLMSSYVNKQHCLKDFWWIAILLGLGLWTKLFFLPVLIGVVAFTLWLAIIVTKLNWKDITYRMIIIIGVPFLIAGAWFLFYNQRYGMFFGGAEFYHLNIVIASGGKALAFVPFIIQIARGTAAFIATFLWSGTWSTVHRPLWQYSFMAPFFLMIIYGLKGSLQVKLCEEKKQIFVACLMILTPIFAGFFYHIIVRIRLTGFGVGTGGYYLFFAWLLIGILFSFSLSEHKSYLMKILTLLAFGFVVYFSISGYWFEAQVYSGIIVKVGDIKTGVGYLPLTFSNFDMVINRLQYYTLPVWAFIFYLGAVILQLFLLVTIVFGKRLDVLSGSNPPQADYLQQHK